MFSAKVNILMINLAQAVCFAHFVNSPAWAESSAGCTATAPHPLVGKPQYAKDRELGGLYSYLRRQISRALMKDRSDIADTFGIQKGLTCSCSFTIRNDGKLADLKLITKSGSDAFDTALLDAVKNVAPVAQPKLAAGQVILLNFDDAAYPKFKFKVIARAAQHQ